MDWREFKAQRIAQLRGSDFAYWVYRAHDPLSCPDSHRALDGIVLSPEHPFWARWTPPHGARCHCAIVGGSLPGGILRRGGDPDKVLPDWWQTVDPTDGLDR
ncbi:MAG: hypothetical protein ACK4L4_19115 [Gemmobacter sp.]